MYADELPIQLYKAKINTHDPASILRGAKIYATYCLVCHSLKYMDNDPFAKKAGITANRMPNASKNWWFGTAPPDLTLITRIHSADWIYTYLHVFYKDPTRPTHSNNLLVDNINMPDPFLGIQGEQALIVDKAKLFASEDYLFIRKAPYYTVLTLERQGTLSPDQFDQLTKDLVNFLVYTGEPKKYTREKMGAGVLLFIFLLGILVFLLKREVWKD
jgi:ubiquinol-cytochrome c reductase cytochrome c1 subunit